MNVYLAGFKTIEKIYPRKTDDIFLLSSFFEHRNGRFGEYVLQEKHILDSGAFSFFGGKSVDWGKYTKEYIDFIKKTRQRLFFELDIDNVTSTQHAEYLRKMIEDGVGKQPIPVWRPCRKIEYWHMICENYPYVAISASGAYDSAWTRKDNATPILRKMIQIAHLKGAKVHGLGFTSTPKLHEIPFDSVDSTTWNVGGKFGNVCVFSDDWKEARQKKPQGMRVQNVNNLHLFNFEQWVKFQKYAEIYL